MFRAVSVDCGGAMKKPEEAYREELGEKRYRILREKGTEPAFSGERYRNTKAGHYLCGACGKRLFSSKTKYDSGSG